MCEGWSLTHSLADPCGGIHLVSVVAFTLVASLQVDADLAADARIQALVDVCTQRGGGVKTGLLLYA